MPLVYKSEPEEVKKIVKAHIGEMTSKHAFRTPTLAKAMLSKTPPTPTPTQAFPVYHLGLKDLAEKGDAKSASLRSWRYLVKQDEQVVASADALVEPDKNVVFSHINEGPLVKGVVSAIQAANANDDVKKGQYEVRILMIPAIYVAALWLVDAAGKSDLAVPMEPSVPPLVTNKVITFKELLIKTQKLAKASVSTQQEDDTLGG